MSSDCLTSPETSPKATKNAAITPKSKTSITFSLSADDEGRVGFVALIGNTESPTAVPPWQSDPVTTKRPACSH